MKNKRPKSEPINKECREIGEEFQFCGTTLRVVPARIKENPCCDCYFVPGTKECDQFMGRDSLNAFYPCLYRYRRDRVSVYCKKV